ncbi:MAG: ABC transporter ATP-binding protein [Acidimicrobiales bacterium]
MKSRITAVLSKQSSRLSPLKSSPLRQFTPHLREVRRTFVIGLTMSVMTAVMQWAAPWPLKFIFDSVLSRKPLPSWLAWLPAAHLARLEVFAGAMLAIAVVLGLSDYLSNRFVATAGQHVVFAVRCRLFRHIEDQSLAFHQTRKSGDLMSRLGGDIQAIQSAVVTGVSTMLRNSLTLVGMAVIMLFIDWRYALLALSLMPVLAYTTRYYLKRIKHIQRQARRAQGEANSAALEVLTSMAVVQAFGAEDIEADRYAAAAGESFEENLRAVIAQAEFTPLMTAAMTLATVGVLYFGVRSVISGRLTAGDLLVFMAYLRGMYSPIRQLSKLAGVIGRAQAAAERVAEILNTKEHVPEPLRPKQITRARGAICLTDVCYAYARGPRVLDGVNLDIPAGSSLALVGATGSGKSTLLRLLPRFLDPSTGTVRLDGMDVSEFSVADLRRQFAFVPQEPYLFRATVSENILYGAKHLSPEAAVAAAKHAGVHDIVASFPNGYDTMIAERGSTLSGGQRQCVAVARAMARNAPVLLLDEPTVGLDAELEAILLQALERLSEGRTTITVSHQLWGLRNADQIAVLEGGHVVENGTHDELVSDRRKYWMLQRLQQGGDLDSPATREPGNRAGQPIKERAS